MKYIIFDYYYVVKFKDRFLPNIRKIFIYNSKGFYYIYNIFILKFKYISIYITRLIVNYNLSNNYVKAKNKRYIIKIQYKKKKSGKRYISTFFFI